MIVYLAVLSVPGIIDAELPPAFELQAPALGYYAHAGASAGSWETLVFNVEQREGSYQLIGVGHEYGKVVADFKGTFYSSQNTVAATRSFRTGNRPLIKMDGR